MTRHRENSLPTYRHAATGSAVSGRHRTFLQPGQTFEASTKSAISIPVVKGNVFGRACAFSIVLVKPSFKYLRHVASSDRQCKKEKLQ